MIDSGTSVSYIRSDILNLIIEYLTEYCNVNQCIGMPIRRDGVKNIIIQQFFCYDNASISSFPNMTFYFHDALLFAYPEHYFWNSFGSFGANNYCLGL